VKNVFEFEFSISAFWFSEHDVYVNVSSGQKFSPTEKDNKYP
jgi:hypothetical protein